MESGGRARYLRYRGRVAAWKIKPKARSQAAGTSKVILLATRCTHLKLASECTPRHWLARPAAQTGSRTGVDLESAPVRASDPAGWCVIQRACRTRLPASNTPTAHRLSTTPSAAPQQPHSSTPPSHQQLYHSSYPPPHFQHDWT
jgi:hypothetical protein